MVAALGGLIVLCGLGVLLHEAITAPDSPELRLSAEHGPARSDGYGLEVTLKNTSRAAAARVRIVATLARDGAEVEQRRVEFDFAPGLSSVHATLIFTLNPRLHALKLNVESHTEP